MRTVLEFFEVRVLEGISITIVRHKNLILASETSKPLASCILRIRSIKDKSSKKYETIINSIEIETNSYTGLIMEGKVIDENLLVNIPKNIDEEITIDGSMVVYVKMMQSKLPLSDAKRVFDILPTKLNHGSSRLVPYHSQLSETPCIEATEDVKIPCKICEKEVDRKKMRLHVGAHILTSNLKDACGKCYTYITKGSGRGANRK